MSHLLNTSVFYQAQNAPVSAWNASLGILPRPSFLNVRQAFFSSFPIPKIGQKVKPKFSISNLDCIIGSIQGVVVKEKTYDSRQVRLYDRESGELVSSKFCEVNGTIEFDKLDASKLFYLIALEDNPLFNASVIDKVQPI